MPPWLAVSRAVAIESPRGWRIAKEKQAHKIDVVTALGMAALAAIQRQSSYDSSLSWVDGGEDDAPSWQRLNFQTFINSGGRIRLW